ncbi:hypothetical protein CK203_045067 [Vitis vinifera]|uniref:PAP/OAS1 substrate-binding-related domain-containing protein n=1 Tax=Vitis vinifera TaxID=29760 RepID=A0A438HWT3_VITVI|nr:hypothetical protein CK203_045067 [Vitis vinifera]
MGNQDFYSLAYDDQRTAAAAAVAGRCLLNANVLGNAKGMAVGTTPYAHLCNEDGELARAWDHEHSKKGGNFIKVVYGEGCLGLDGCRGYSEIKILPKDYVQEFMAEAVSFLLRNAPVEQLIKGVRKIMLEAVKKPLLMRKISSLVEIDDEFTQDGDIDLTVLCSSNVEEALASDVHAVLKGERQNENAEFEVKDAQFIIVEVKPVKCLVKDIVIDISFNQLGGLSTLCFLKQVDRLIGKDHLFKRSIILIKSWCYYESRILGAIMMALLAVLYRFLDYFSKFDWDNYCISLNGSVCKSSPPDIVAELPENGEVIQDELKNFFASTLERHRSKYMAEIQNFALTFGSRGSSSSSSSSGTEMCSRDEIFLTSLDSGKITRIDDETASMGVLSSPSLSKMDSSIDGNAVSGYCLTRDSKESASYGFHV